MAQLCGKIQSDEFLCLQRRGSGFSLGIAGLMEDRRRHPAKAVAGHLAFVTHALQRLQDRAVARRRVLRPFAMKYPLAVSAQLLQQFENLLSL